MLRASVKFLERALRMGTIELMRGMKMPIKRDVSDALSDGITVVLTPVVSGKRSIYIV